MTITSKPNYGEAIATIDKNGRVVANHQFNVFLDDLSRSASTGESSAEQQGQASIAHLESIVARQAEAFGFSVQGQAGITQTLEQQSQQIHFLANLNKSLLQRMNDLEQKLDGYQTFPG